ncbi:MAG: histidine phosphatase family protein [Rhodobacteraceae bacterium]|nr:histidine phosphatase family protein [Paracoccaceae bacterium]
MLLRHTRPKGAAGLCYGRLDLDLDDSFEAELARLTSEIPAVTAIVTSPLSRCRLLADRLGAVRGMDVRIAPDFIEMDFGSWEGVPWDAVPRQQLDAWAADFFQAAPHGGETVQALADRVARALVSVPDGALVVTHAGVIKAALAARAVEGAWDARPEFGQIIELG